jgi:hypothetical protein
MNATAQDAISGKYQLQPGSPRSVLGQRPVLAVGRLARLLCGQRREQVMRTLSSVFALCSHAHRHCAELALAAAQGEAASLSASQAPVLLWLETARDHLRTVALDWPQRASPLRSNAVSLDWLRDCPLSLTTTCPGADATAAHQALFQLRDWLEQRVLAQSVDDWLPAHRHPEALALWCQSQSARLVPAGCLASWHSLAHTLKPAMRCLNLLDSNLALQSSQLRQLAQTLLLQPDFAQQPTWLGACAENGPWTRLRHRSEQESVPHSAWTRMSARWIDLLEIAATAAPNQAPDGPPLLATGALRLGDGEALAWCEMARGLLLHWVQIDAQGRVQDYRVLAPTEWNFHPAGALARALTDLAPDDTRSAQLLAAAFDPCVACTITGADAITPAPELVPYRRLA